MKGHRINILLKLDCAATSSYRLDSCSRARADTLWVTREKSVTDKKKYILMNSQTQAWVKSKLKQRVTTKICLQERAEIK